MCVCTYMVCNLYQSFVIQRFLIILNLQFWQKQSPIANHRMMFVVPQILAYASGGYGNTHKDYIFLLYAFRYVWPVCKPRGSKKHAN